MDRPGYGLYYFWRSRTIAQQPDVLASLCREKPVYNTFYPGHTDVNYAGTTVKIPGRKRFPFLDQNKSGIQETF